MEQLDSRPASHGLPPLFFEAAALLQNTEPNNVVVALHSVRTVIDEGGNCSQETASKVEGALALQNQWRAWTAEREQVGREAQRGRECLAQTRRELAELRAKLVDWSSYESVGGANALPDLVQAIMVKERIEKLLPDWIESRERRLGAMTRKMEAFATENGLEDLPYGGPRI